MSDAERIVLCGGATRPSRARPHNLIPLALSGRDQNVTLEVSNLSKQIACDIPDEVADLIEIATYVYCADQAVTRGGPGVADFGKHWRRKLIFHIPVRMPDI